MARKRWGPGNALWEWQNKRSRKSSKGVKRMARRRSFRARARRAYSYYAPRARRSFNRGGGLMGMLKPFLVGAIAGALKPRIPVVSGLPTGAAGAAGGYIVKRTPVGAALGAAGEFIGTPYLSGFLGGVSSGIRFY